MVGNLVSLNRFICSAFGVTSAAFHVCCWHLTVQCVNPMIVFKQRKLAYGAFSEARGMLDKF